MAWLSRIGYRSYYSGISINAECPNLLIRQHLSAAIEKAYESTKERSMLSATAWVGQWPAPSRRKCLIASLP